MTNNSSTPTVTPQDETAPAGYDEAQRMVVRSQRREVANRLKELRRQADGAKQRATTAQQRFERLVAQVASDRPEREDWYEHPGALPRKTLLEAASLNTMTLHRIMERHRKLLAKGKRPTRRTPK